jgi:DNA-binding NtrC family response regulator
LHLKKISELEESALQEKVLIVEDEVHARTGLTELVSSWGYRARGAADGRDGLDQVIAWQPAIVVTDLKMPRMDGMELLRRIGDLPERYCVVMLTAQGSIESAVEAMRAGAWDYLPKPVDPARLRGILDSARRQVEAQAQVEPLGAAVSSACSAVRPDTLGQMVGSSPEMKAVFSLVQRVASSKRHRQGTCGAGAP